MKQETLTEQFDTRIRGLVNSERQKDYGHPADHFKRSAALKSVIADCPDPRLRHALEMICDKMARLCHSPDHFDSWLDIAGYARTAVMILDYREEKPFHGFIKERADYKPGPRQAKPEIPE